MQNEHVVCYESRNVKDHDKNYPTHELELETIIHSLKMWRHYLMVNVTYATPMLSLVTTENDLAC
jgi:hypothetical protein